jgi:hypothetical protein
MPSQMPLNVHEAITAALPRESEAPVVFWEDGRGLAYVVLFHAEEAFRSAIGFALAPVTSSHTGEWRATEFNVRLLSDPTSFGMTGKKIRSLPIGDLLTSARRALSERLSGDAAGRTLRIISPSELAADAMAAFQTRRRSGVERDDRAYATLALEYAFLVQDGDRSPSQTLAKRFGGAAGTWANRIAEARKRGFLTPVQSGEAGGSVTDKTLRALGHRGEPDE